jgi:hypothetical protein
MVISGPAQHVGWPKANTKIRPFAFFLKKENKRKFTKKIKIYFQVKNY